MMINLTDMKTVRSILGRHGFHFSKKLGQNFLIDPSVCPRIAEEGNAAAGYGVLEIGPGIGTMTQYLAHAARGVAALEIGPGIGTLTQQLALRAEKVTSVELDQRLLPILEETVGEFENLHILHGDILQFDVPQLLEQEFAGLHVAVCANLPYYITSPIVMMLLESGLPLQSITVLVQKEAAQRLCATPGTRECGAVTMAVQYYAEARTLFPVSRGSFLPAPKVDSMVMQLTLRAAPPVDAADPAGMFRLIRAGFGQRRKTLPNALGSCGLTKEQAIAALQQAQLPLTARAEQCTLEDFARLSNIVFPG